MVVYVAPKDPVQIEFPIPSFSLGITQMHIPDSPPESPVINRPHVIPEPKTPENIRKPKDAVKTLMPSGAVPRPIGDNINRIYRWATDCREGQHTTTVWIRNGDDVELQRADLQSLGLQRKVRDTVVDYCCAMFNTSSIVRFCKDFYCLSPRLMEVILTDKNIEQYVGPNKEFVPILSQYIGRGQRWFNEKRAKEMEYVINSLTTIHQIILSKNYMLTYFFNCVVVYFSMSE
ncbi:hypothetical protein HN873_021462 [Arachis hypogaea]